MTAFTTDYTAPQTLSGLVTSTLIGAVRLRWNSTYDQDLWGTEVWYSTSSSFYSATLLATVFGTSHYIMNTVDTNPVSTFYFWVRAVNRYGKVGDTYPYVPPTTSTTGWLTPGSNTYKDYGTAGADFSTPTNAYTENGVYTVGTANGSGSIDDLYFYNFGIAVPTGQFIQRVKYRLKAKDSTGRSYIGITMCWDGSAFSTTGGTDLGAQRTTFPLTTTNTLWDWFTIDRVYGTTVSVADVNSSNFGLKLSMSAAGAGASISLDYISVNIEYAAAAAQPGITGTASSHISSYHMSSYDTGPGGYSGWTSSRGTATSAGTEFVDKIYTQATGLFSNILYSQSGVSTSSGGGTNAGGAWTYNTTGSTGSNSTSAIAYSIGSSTVTGTPNYPYLGGGAGNWGAYEPCTSFGTYYQVAATSQVALPSTTTAVNYSVNLGIDWTIPSITTGNAAIWAKIVVRNVTSSTDLKISEFKLCEWSGASAAVQRAQSQFQWESTHNASIAANDSIRIELYLKKVRSDAATTFSVYYDRATLWMDREL